MNRIDRDLMAAIGHELRHAIEVLNNREVATTRGMVHLYEHEGIKNGSVPSRPSPPSRPAGRYGPSCGSASR
jgi:hypothetical protein